MKKLSNAAQIYSLVWAMGLIGLLPTGVPHAQTLEEICDNAMDDDGDGLIDLNDPDCECMLLVPTSLIPNPSFEEINCCPIGRADLNCANGWLQASEPTTDYLNTCGWMGPDNFQAPLPFPDGEGVVGFRDGRVLESGPPEYNWKEYAGACLLSPLLAGRTYRFEFDVGFVDTRHSPPIQISFYGSPSCVNLPFGRNNQAFGCPSNDVTWRLLGATLVAGGGNVWSHAYIEVTPITDIAAIAIGPPCQPTTAEVSTYYYFDNLILADFRSFGFLINPVDQPCSPNFALEMDALAGETLQWYKNGIALVGETQPRLSRMYGDGRYQVRIVDASGCRLSQAYAYSKPVFRSSSQELICHDETYTFGGIDLQSSGTYVDTLRSVNQCDSIVTLDLQVLGQLADTVAARIFPDENYVIGRNRYSEAGTYLASLPSSLGCDSLVLLHLEHYNVYVPNAFSPNQDGVNDYFEVFGKGGELQSSHLKIYDRWGAQVFSGERWDGRQRGSMAAPGVYLYVAELLMDDGITRQRSGSVNLLR